MGLIVKLNGSIIPSGYVHAYPNNNTVTNFILVNSSEVLEPGSLELIGGGGYLRLLGAEALSIGEDLPITYSPVDMPAGFSWIVRPPDLIEADKSVNISIKSEDAGPGTTEVIIVINDFTMTLRNVAALEPHVYTNRDILFRTYGKLNVLDWGDFDGSQDLNAIYTVIQQVCYDASRMIDAALKNGVYNEKVPFEAPYPPMIQRLATLKAGDLLYTLNYKYTTEFSKGITARREEYATLLGAINSGRIALGVDQGINSPI